MVGSGSSIELWEVTHVPDLTIVWRDENRTPAKFKVEDAAPEGDWLRVDFSEDMIPPDVQWKVLYIPSNAIASAEVVMTKVESDADD